MNQTKKTNEVTKRRKRKFPKGPNPLSVKKRSRQSKPDCIVNDRVSLSKVSAIVTIYRILLAVVFQKRRVRLQKRRAIEQLARTIQNES